MQSAEGSLLAMIVDQDTATGLLLTGVGQVDLRKRSNFLIVDDSEWRCRRLGSQRVGCGRQHEAGRVPPPRRVAGGQASRLWQRGTEGWSQAASLPASQLHHIHHLCIRQLTITTHASPPPPQPLMIYVTFYCSSTAMAWSGLETWVIDQLASTNPVLALPSLLALLPLPPPPAAACCLLPPPTCHHPASTALAYSRFPPT